MGGFGTPLSHVASPELVEALAGLLACFSFAVELALPLSAHFRNRLNHIGFNYLRSRTHMSFGGRVYDDIIYLLLELPNFDYFLHVFRETNVLAHDCAYFARTSRHSFSWIGASPINLHNFEFSNKDFFFEKIS